MYFVIQLKISFKLTINGVFYLFIINGVDVRVFLFCFDDNVTYRECFITGEILFSFTRKYNNEIAGIFQQRRTKSSMLSYRRKSLTLGQ